MHLRTPSIFALLGGLLLSGTAQASPPHPLQLEIVSGWAMIGHNGYDDDNNFEPRIGYDFELFEVNVGYLKMGEFESTTLLSAGVEVEGVSLGVVKTFPLHERISITIQGGLYNWRADAWFNGRKVGEDDGTDPWLGAGLRFPITQRIEAQINYQHFDDISGSFVNRYSGGALFRF